MGQKFWVTRWVKVCKKCGFNHLFGIIAALSPASTDLLFSSFLVQMFEGSADCGMCNSSSGNQEQKERLYPFNHRSLKSVT